MKAALYNENDAYAAQWIRNLAEAGHVAPGVVDERSIKDLSPADVGGAGQRHFFAGVGVWSYALRLAGWSDEDSIWTGSCPCQPWSGAGKGKRHSDERHLWPDWFRLINVHRPRLVVGEQVASPAGLAWLDDVHAQMEGAGYAFAAFDLCSAGFGAPHQRQRLYFAAVADADSGARGQGRAESRGSDSRGDAQPRAGSRSGRSLGGLAHHHQHGRGQLSAARVHAEGPPRNDADGRGATRSVGNADSEHAGRNTGAGDRSQAGLGVRASGDELGASGATRGHWADAEWLYCRDDFWRPVEPGTFPLAHGAPQRVGRLRAYGNAIDAHLAAQFLGALRETLDGGCPF